MNSKDYFKDIYKDFFGVETLPSIEVEKKEEDISSQKGSQEEMISLFEDINKLYISEESKDMLKKMIEYMRKYNEKIESNYVPYRVLLEVNNKYTKEEVIRILKTSSKYFSYIDNNSDKELSLYSIDKELDLNKYGFICIDNLEGFNLEDLKERNKFIHTLEEFLSIDNKIVTIISGTKEELTGFFLGREEIRNKYFSFLLNNFSL